jgi:hypothetical protein
MVVLAAIFFGIGIYSATDLINKKIRNNFIYACSIIAFGLIIIFIPAYSFFNNTPGSISMMTLKTDFEGQTTDFLVAYSVQVIKQIPNYRDFNTICIISGISGFEKLNFMHVKEYFQFYLPGQKIVPYFQNVPGNYFYISPNCSKDFGSTAVSKQNWLETHYCQKHERFICPNSKKELVIFQINKP